MPGLFFGSKKTMSHRETIRQPVITINREDPNESCRNFGSSQSLFFIKNDKSFEIYLSLAFFLSSYSKIIHKNRGKYEQAPLGGRSAARPPLLGREGVTLVHRKICDIK
jgi:hypothetical protein